MGIAEAHSTLSGEISKNLLPSFDFFLSEEGTPLPPSPIASGVRQARSGALPFMGGSGRKANLSTEGR
jgi:hypothetical protein